MIGKLVQTDAKIVPLLLRLVLGLVMFPHGAQKLLGWWGGAGYGGTMTFFTQSMGIPTPVAFLVVLTEFFGSLALLAGFLTRLAALAVACVMVGAVWLVHLPYGFFMNWSGLQQGEGFEYHLLALGIAIPLVLKGSGVFSVDRLLLQGRPSRPLSRLLDGSLPILAASILALGMLFFSWMIGLPSSH